MLGPRTVLSITFNEPLLAGTVTPAAVALTEAGPDGRHGTRDDRRISGGALSYRHDIQTGVVEFAAPLDPGLYALQSYACLYFSGLVRALFRPERSCGDTARYFTPADSVPAVLRTHNITGREVWRPAWPSMA